MLLFVVSCKTQKKVVAAKPVITKPSSKIVKHDEPIIEVAEEEIREKPINVYVDQNGSYIFPGDTETYVAFFAPYAVEKMKEYGIPASITLAQGLLESARGKSRLATIANNHFGIKCHNWTGPSISHDDDALGECFRKYEDPADSFKDHSLFLTGRKRYAKLFTYDKTDYKSWAHGLKRAGYATNPRYAHLLISLIEKNQLYRFDSSDGAPLKKVVPAKRAVLEQQRILENDNFKYHTVVKGDTMYNISKRYGISLHQLKQWNGKFHHTIHVGERIKVGKK